MSSRRSPWRAPRIVLFGMMTKMPVAGVVWQTVQYLVGLRRLGYDVWYVEAHARTPSMFMETERCDGAGRAAAFIHRVMERFGLKDRWAYHALHDDGRLYGASETQLHDLFREAALLINLHGGTEPRSEYSATGRLIYLGTDPVRTEVELSKELQATIDFLEPHRAFFTFGENYGEPECGVPVSSRFRFRPTRQPIVLSLWTDRGEGEGDCYTTIASWKQDWREVWLEGKEYQWSKHHEFLKCLDLPERTSEAFELALSRCPEDDAALLRSRGWRVRNALAVSNDLDRYRRFIVDSRGEFTVAKDQNVRLRSGWFSDRSATYLAAGRPVITQDTGFGRLFPTDSGLFAFNNLDQVLTALAAIRADYRAHSEAAVAIAREHFDSDTVLGTLLEEVGLSRRARPAGSFSTDWTSERNGAGSDRNGVRSDPAFPGNMDITTVSRRPTRLPEATEHTVLSWPLPRARSEGTEPLARPTASVIVVTLDQLPFTRLCLESLLTHTESPAYELIVVDNGSTDGTTDYLLRLGGRHPHVRLQFNGQNVGFPAGCNVGLEMARGEVVVLLNNDTIPPPGWLAPLCHELEQPGVGAVGPVTNRAPNETQVDASYETYEEFLQFAAAVRRRFPGQSCELPRLAMICFAMRREVQCTVGPLDESFGVGTFEDDDFCFRIREAGYQLRCVEGVFVHHFGQASLGELAQTDRYGPLLRANRQRFERKWGIRWQPHGRRTSPEYEDLVARVRKLAPQHVPPGSRVLVVSRGDEELVRLENRIAAHFPQAEGSFAGHYPADSGEAIAHLESLRRRGADYLIFPRTALWWLEHYQGFARHLNERYERLAGKEDTCVIFALGPEGAKEMVKP